MKKKTTFLRLFALLLCAALLFPALAPVSAAADEGEEGLWIPPEPDDYGVLEPQVMEQMVRDYVTTWGLQKGKISIGYCYLDTGDTWYYTGDEWTYSADLYKVPLMMTLASWEARGNISQDT